MPSLAECFRFRANFPARYSNVARSADWVQASHDTVTESSFATYGSARENVDKGMIIIAQ